MHRWCQKHRCPVAAEPLRDRDRWAARGSNYPYPSPPPRHLGSSGWALTNPAHARVIRPVHMRRLDGACCLPQRLLRAWSVPPWRRSTEGGHAPADAFHSFFPPSLLSLLPLYLVLQSFFPSLPKRRGRSAEEISRAPAFPDLQGAVPTLVCSICIPIRSSPFDSIGSQCPASSW